MNNEQPQNGEAPKQKRRRITWANADDIRALVIASMGFSNTCVQSYTGLSTGQIYYRLKLAQMVKNRQMFRNGEGPVAKAFIRQNAGMVESRVQKSLRKAHQTDPTKTLPDKKV